MAFSLDFCDELGDRHIFIVAEHGGRRGRRRLSIRFARIRLRDAIEAGLPLLAEILRDLYGSIFWVARLARTTVLMEEIHSVSIH